MNNMLHTKLMDAFHSKFARPLKTTATENCRWCYVIYNPLNRNTKIGVTDNLGGRIGRLRTASGIDVITLLAIELLPFYDENARELEAFLHEYFKVKRKIGEWFELSIKDVLAIRQLFYVIEGEDMVDNILHRDKINIPV